MRGHRLLATISVLGATVGTAFGAFAAPEERLHDTLVSGVGITTVATDVRTEGTAGPVADANRDESLTAEDLHVLPDPSVAASAVVVELDVVPGPPDAPGPDSGTVRLAGLRSADGPLPAGWVAGTCSPPPVPRCTLGPGTVVGSVRDGVGGARVQLWLLDGAPDLPGPLTVELVVAPDAPVRTP